MYENDIIEKPKKKHSFLGGMLTGWAIGFASTGLLAFVLIVFILNNLKNYPHFSEGEAGFNEKLSYLQDVIEDYFLWDVDEEDMTEGIYKGLLESLDDPYSVYFTKEEFDSLMEESSGIYYGIGVQISQNVDTNIITVVRVFDGSPAAEAGVKMGDIIAEVNGTDVSTMGIDDVVRMIKGESGTKIPIKFLREDEFVTLDVERREVEVPTVESRILEDNIGYVIISSFDTVTYSQFYTAIDDLREKGITRVIVDLRNNGGGYLDTVLDMLDYILPKGLLVYTEDKAGKKEEYFSDDRDTWDEATFVILTNEYTASASEIFSGAMRDFGRATLVGTNTFGKGIVQSIIPMSDGSGMKITTSEYFTPSGFALHKVGLKPDVEVELEKGVKVYDETSDNQLQEAIRIISEQ